MLRLLVLVSFCIVLDARTLAETPAGHPAPPPVPSKPGPVFIGDKPSADDLKEIREIAEKVGGHDILPFIRGYKVYWDIDESQIYDAYVSVTEDQPRVRRMALVRIFPRAIMSRRPTAKTVLTDHWGAYPLEKEDAVMVLPAKTEWKNVKKIDGDLAPITISGDITDEVLIEAVDFARENQELKDRFQNYAKNIGVYPAPRLTSISAKSPSSVDVTYRTGEENGFIANLEKSEAGWKVTEYKEWTPPSNK